MKKILVIFGVFVLALLVGGSTVLAESDESKKPERPERFERPRAEWFREHAPSFFVGPQGQTLIIRGEIISLSGTTTPAIDEVKVWGLLLQVDMTAANFIPEGTSKENLQVGDKVNIKGTMDQQTGVITASTVHLFHPLRVFPLTPLPTTPATP